MRKLFQTTVVTDPRKRFRMIRNCMFLSGLSVFAQLYLFQPMLSDLCAFFHTDLPGSSLAVSASTLGMAAGLFLFAFKADAFVRERLMGISLVVSALLTIASAFITVFPLLLAVNFLKGMALSGVSAVALAYLTDEVDKSMIGLAISLYLSGNTIGGMSGRVSGTLLAGWGGWQYAVAVIGGVSLVLGYFFIRRIPASRQSNVVAVSFREKIGQMRTLLVRPQLLCMYLIAALSMGAFVSVYNYLSFLLESPAFGLPHQVVAMIFMMYTAGVAGSIVTGMLSDKYSPRLLLQGALLLMCIGLVLLLVMHLAMVILGLGLFTFAFFSAHTMASRIVSMNAPFAKSSATSIYWLFYYAGSSLVGSLTGIVLTRYGWTAFVEVLLILTGMALTVAVFSAGTDVVGALRMQVGRSRSVLSHGKTYEK
mgnify:CR=1 FL=1